MLIEIFRRRRVTREGEGVRSPLPFFKNWIVVIYVLNFSFKMQFLRVSRRKNRRFFPAGPFFLALYMITYQSAPISRKLPCPKNFRVTRLRQYLSFGS